jgi:enoyl-CoA hydratase/carnithine racemase
MADTTTDILVTRPEPGIALVTLNRPEKRNALRAETFAELGAAMAELVPDPETRAIVVTGAGDRAFSVGADLSSPPSSVDDIDGMLARIQGVFTWMEESGTPTIAALNGDAFGGACEIALACHFRVMARGARIGQTETDFGIMPAAGGTQRMARLVGVSRALECIVLGRKIDAEEALRIGLVHRIAEPGRALHDALALAREVAARAPIAVRGAIRALFTGLNRGSIQEGERAEREGLARCAASADVLEGVAAFFEKRAPRFQGK